MSITLTEPYRKLAEQQAESAGYDDLNLYIEYLIDKADTVAADFTGLADAAAGRTRPIRDALKDLALKHDLAVQKTTGNEECLSK